MGLSMTSRVSRSCVAALAALFALQTFVIAQGQVEVMSKGVHGSNLRIALLTEGEFFGETDLVSDKPSDVTVRTTTPCVLLTLSRRDLDAVLAENANLGEDFKRAIAEHLELR